jgi:cell division protein FtsI (penicillin-binding protein 3)
MTPARSSDGPRRAGRKSAGSTAASARGAKRPAAATRSARRGAVPAEAGRSPENAGSRTRRGTTAAPRSAGWSRSRGARPGTASLPRGRRLPRPLKLATGPFRLWSAFCVVAFVLSLFAARLVQLQGIDENDYAAMALAQGAQTVTLEAPRAPIYDRNGVALARTVESAKLVADPTFTKPFATTIAALLHKRLGVDYLGTVDLLRTPHTRYVELARHVKPELAATLVAALARAKLPGVYSVKDTSRVYPDGDVAANVVGFLGADGTGLAGMESTLNSSLAGKNGSATFEVADGQELPLAQSTVKEPVEGTGVRLTLDQDLQFLAQRRLGQAVKQSGGTSGVAVVMDVKSGQLLALADYPTFDPANPQLSPAADYGSRALQDAYEPGSVEKVLTFASLIDAGYVTPRTQITVPATLTRGGHVIHDYFPHGTLHLTAAGVLAKSSNIGTVRAAEQMPKEQLYRYLRSFGLGRPTSIGLGGESAGLLPAGRTWQPLNRDTIAFGQGLSVNAVQMTAAVAAVANSGTYVQPSLIEGRVDSTGAFTPAPPPARHRVVSKRAAAAVGRMMEQVVGPQGTAPAAAIPGYRVAGKTGTAQRVGQSCGCYDGSFTVSFAGFAPADDPRFVVYVVVQQPKNGGGGGSIGGPVFHDLMAAALQKYGVPPTGARSPALRLYW